MASYKPLQVFYYVLSFTIIPLSMILRWLLANRQRSFPTGLSLSHARELVLTRSLGPHRLLQTTA